MAIPSFLNHALTSIPLYQLLFLLSAALFLLQIIELRKKKQRAGAALPPGPKRLPLIGNLHQVEQTAPHKSFQSLCLVHGPLMFLQLGSVPTIVVSSADVAMEITKTHDLLFSGRPALHAAKKLTYGYNDVAFAPYGEYWREARKISILEILGQKRVQSFESVRAEEVTGLRKAIARSCSRTAAVNLSEMMLVTSNNVVCRTSFGKKFNGEGALEMVEGGDGQFQEMVRETQNLLGGFCIADFMPWMGWFHKLDGVDARIEKNFRDLDNFFDEVIEEHLRPQGPKPEHEDLVDVLLRVQKDPNQAVALTNQQIKGVLLDMFVAGTDTSSATVTWTMTELMRNPSIMKRAQDEVRMTIDPRKGKVEESDLHELTYLKMVIKESLRLHPPAPISVPRETTGDCTVCGFKIPSKTRVFFNLHSISNDLKYWDDPKVFKPERFLGKNSAVDFRGQNFEFLPFGAGRRGCPGIGFAVVLVELLLANLLYSFDWKLPDGVQREDIDMDDLFGITMHKKVPLCLVATPTHHACLAS